MDTRVVFDPISKLGACNVMSCTYTHVTHLLTPTTIYIYTVTFYFCPTGQPNRPVGATISRGPQTTHTIRVPPRGTCKYDTRTQ